MSASNSDSSSTTPTSLTMTATGDESPAAPPRDSVTTAVDGLATSASVSDENRTGPSSSSSPKSSPTPPPELELPISWPQDGKLSLDWIHNLMACFDWSSRNVPPSEFHTVLPVHVFDSLILIASKVLHKEPNCLSIDPFRPTSDSGSDAASTVVVVGDVHGQLHDLLFLLRDAGYPADDRIFVFNGDYVDRGAWGLEIFMILLAWKVNLRVPESSPFFFPQNLFFS